MRTPARWGVPLCLLAVLLLSHGAPEAQARPAERPNIVVITTDDQPLSMLRGSYMPRTMHRIAAEGTSFDNAIVTTPLCCPSRASLLTGQYGHNHGVLQNAYDLLDDKPNVLPAWLRRAGYRTAHVGKFMNGYHGSVDDPLEVAPGWDIWFTTVGSTRYFDYDVSANGRPRHFGKGRRDHVTRVINRKAGTLVRRYTPDGKPLYLQVDHRAPHTETNVNSGGNCGLKAIPEKNRDRKRLRDVKPPDVPSFNELDVADKPSFIRDRPLLDRRRLKKIERRYRCAAASLRSVDRGVERIIDSLKQTHQLKSTVLVFTTDQGFFYGEHRIARDKTIPYEEAIRVPLLIRAPKRYLGGAQAVPLVDEPVANIDIAPTVLELAGAEPCTSTGDCRVIDGRSLVPLLRGTSGWPLDRGLVVEYDGAASKGMSSCEYHGIRAQGWVYVEHVAIPNALTGGCEETFETELYNLVDDPFQLQSLPSEGSVAASLRARLARLRDCAGIAGRDPAPAGVEHCE